MSREDIQKLLGGYATGTLTAEEQQALFAAALEDQELFDALARDQSLHDLLRDPAARAELLGALDGPASHPSGWRQWLRRPLVAGLATAGVAGIAGLIAWHGMGVPPVKQAAPIVIAELKSPSPELAPAPSPAQPATPAPAIAPRPMKTRGVIVDVPRSVPSPPPPALPEAPAPASPAPVGEKALKAEVEVTAAQATLQTTQEMSKEMARAVSKDAILDARTLFYANLPAPGANAFVQTGGAGGVVQPQFRAAAPRSDAAPRTAKTMASLTTATDTAFRLGVRISIFRSAGDADLTTVLDPGETVRLKLIPNADGFLYVAEGTRIVASGAAQRLKPFETPELRFEGSGQKLLYVILSRRPQTVDPLSLKTRARDNLLERSAAQDRATYVVNRPAEPDAAQVVVPVTLTYR